MYLTSRNPLAEHGSLRASIRTCSRRDWQSIVALSSQVLASRQVISSPWSRGVQLGGGGGAQHSKRRPWLLPVAHGSCGSTRPRTCSPSDKQIDCAFMIQIGTSTQLMVLMVWLVHCRPLLRSGIGPSVTAAAMSGTGRSDRMSASIPLHAPSAQARSPAYAAKPAGAAGMRERRFSIS